MIKQPRVQPPTPAETAATDQATAASTVTIPAGSRIYVSTQGDWWDMIALRVYGRKRGNEHLMFRLLEANYPLREVSNFPAGIPVVVPTVDLATEIPLVPWKSASRIIEM